MLRFKTHVSISYIECKGGGERKTGDIYDMLEAYDQHSHSFDKYGTYEMSFDKYETYEIHLNVI